MLPFHIWCGRETSGPEFDLVVNVRRLLAWP